MKKLTIFLALLLFAGFTAVAQMQISGTVTGSSDGLSIPGVSVVVKDNLTIGTTTDLDGKYSITVPSDAESLIFSFVGMKTREIPIGGRSVIDVVMEEEVLRMDEVVVVAYGQQKRSEMTGSVATVDPEELGKISESNVLKGLDGEISGVQVIQDDGQPGEGPTIRIRGIGSISGSSNPLYVIDGVPFNGDINTIEPNDIASLTVLKDASANALYGHRGANGVIIITTQKGKKNSFNVSADVSTGIVTRATKDYDFMTDPAEYYETFYLASRNNLYINEGLTLSEASTQAARSIVTDVDGLGYNLGYNNYNVNDDNIIDPTTGKLNPSASLLYNDDWAEYLFDNAVKTKAYLNINGGSENATYLFSLGYDSNEGYAINSGFDRFTARLSVTQSIKDWMEIGGTMNYAHTDQDAPIQNFGSGTYANLFNWARIVAPIYPIFAYDENGNQRFDDNGDVIYDFGDGVSGPEASPWTRTLGGTQNPYATTREDIQSNVYENLNGRYFAKVHFLKDFTFTYNGSVDLRSGSLTRFATPIGGDASNAGGRGRAIASKALTTTHQQLLDYNKDFGKHNVTVLLGHESSNYNYKYLLAHKTNYLLTDQYVLDGAVVIEDVGNFERDYLVEGYLSRLTYNYDGKYFVNLSYRRDGSSVFHPDNRWGNFWGAGVGYNISQENFMSFATWLNHLKLKASFGQQGNDIVYYPDGTFTRNYYPYRNQYQVVNNNGEVGISLAFLGNKDLTWEKSDNINVGLESVFLNNRVSFDFEYFIRKVSDLLYNSPLPPSSGAPVLPENVGDMENKGFEFTISGTIIKTEDLVWNMNLNGTHFKNEITDLPEELIRDGRFGLEEGRSRYDYHLFEFAGVDPDNGDALWYYDVLDTDGNPTGERETTNVYSEADRYFLDKSPIPDLYGGFSTDVTYKNFDFSIGFSYQLGGYGYDATYYNLFDATQAGQNFVKEAMTDTWTPENTDASLPRIDAGYGDNYLASSMYLVDASYLSLKNITLGYTLPEKLVNKIGVSSVRVYGLANNVYLWSKRQGFDPRMSPTGLSQNEYSVMRTTSIGVNIKF